MARQLPKTRHFTLVVLLVLAMAGTALGQGRSGGAGGRGGPPPGGGGPPAGVRGGPPAGTGVDRGLGRASERSGGRSDRGLATASENSRGRSDEGLERAREANLEKADRELRDHPGIPRTLRLTANDLREGYEAALATNPNLKFGHFVAATRLEQNLGRRHPNITRDAILSGLANGRSIGRTLQDLGLSENEAKEGKKQAEREIKNSKKR